MALQLSGSQLEVKETCIFLCSESNAEEKVIFRVNAQICTDVPYASISTSFLKHEWRSECTGKAKRTLAPSVFPSQLLTQCLVCGPHSFNRRSKWPHHCRGGCRHPSFTLPTGLGWPPPPWSLPQSEVAIHNESQEVWARQFGWGERDWNRELDSGYKPWACQEGHKEQEGRKRRGSAHVTHK